MIPSTPSKFFEAVEKSDLKNLCVWDGELYLELHNGTYTSQAAVKRMNRLCEFLLRDCEFLSVALWLASKGTVVRHWREEWKKVLLNQFHDVLPGSSIGTVYEDAQRLYSSVVESCETYLSQNKPDDTFLILNTLPWPRLVNIEENLYLVPALSLSKKVLSKDFDVVKVSETQDNIVLE